VIEPEAIVRLHLGKLWLPYLEMEIPVHGFLIKHPDGAGLVDTGYGTDVGLIKEFRAVMVPIVDALRRHDVEPADIQWVINSHLHFDHCGQNAVFPHAPVYVQRQEHARIREHDYTIAEWLDYAGARYELLDGGAEIRPGVRVITTPGHTPGHQSIAIDTTAGPALVVGDAAWNVEQFEGADPPPHAMEDVPTYHVSLGRLRALQPAAVHFCHDRRIRTASGPARDTGTAVSSPSS
jgi:N-acyl homoserine lactone hydrolase